MESNKTGGLLHLCRWDVKLTPPLPYSRQNSREGKQSAFVWANRSKIRIPYFIKEPARTIYPQNNGQFSDGVVKTLPTVHTGR